MDYSEPEHAEPIKDLLEQIIMYRWKREQSIIKVVSMYLNEKQR